MVTNLDVSGALVVPLLAGAFVGSVTDPPGIVTQAVMARTNKSANKTDAAFLIFIKSPPFHKSLSYFQDNLPVI